MEDSFDNPLLPVPQQEPPEDPGPVSVTPPEGERTAPGEGEPKKESTGGQGPGAEDLVKYYIDCIAEALAGILGPERAGRARAALGELAAPSLPSNPKEKGIDAAPTSPRAPAPRNARAPRRQQFGHSR